MVDARENIRRGVEQMKEDDDTTELTRAREKLKEVYNTILGEEVDEQIKQVEQAQANNKSKAAWNIINELTGRRTPRKGQLEGGTQEERVKNWYSHFKGLLGKPPEVLDEEDQIQKVFDKLPIGEMHSHWRS